MLKWLLLVLGLQLAGELVVRFLSLPLPGPVIGMVLFFIILLRIGHVPRELNTLADGLLSNLLLFFIPAAVGVTAYLDLLSAHIVAVLAAIAASSLLAIVVTGMLMQRLARRSDDDAV